MSDIPDSLGSAAPAPAQPKSRALWFLFLLALTNLMWAAQGTAVKFLSRQLGPIAITFLPFYVTTILFVPLLVRARRRNPQAASLTWRDWRALSIAGIGGQVLAQLGMTWGINQSLASNGAILNLLIPVFTALLASVMLGERMTLLRAACLLVGLAGVALLSVEDLQQSSFLRSRYLAGNLLILGGCLGSAFYNVYCKGLLRRFGEIEILVFSYLTACLASLPLLLWAEPFHLAQLASLDWKSWASFAFLAVFMYGVSMLLFFYVLQHLDVTVASASFYLVPLFGVLLAGGLLGEHLSTSALCGAVITLGATLAIMRWDKSAV
jgi:drug/metabolite transporter (DMT)-like permease